MSYKELKDNFLEEVGRIDVSKLGLSFCGGLKDYAELLQVIAMLPDDTHQNLINKEGFNHGFGAQNVPQKEN